MPRRDPNPPDLARARATLARARPSSRDVHGPFGGPLRGPGADQWVPGPATLPPTTWDEAQWDPDDTDDDLDDVPGEEQAPGRHRSPPRVLTLPAAFRHARVHVSWQAVLGLTVVLVVAVLVFAARVAWAEQSSAPQAVPRPSGTAGRSVPAAFATSAVGSPGSSGSSGSSVESVESVESIAAGSTSSAARAPTMVVDVIGQVVRPGVVSVDQGARLVAVLAAVGGALPSADLRRLNLARVVSDGEQVFVPLPGESPPTAVPPVGGPSVGAPGSTGSSSAGGVVDLNTADVGVLDGLPGVGPVLAQRIVDWRAQHGRFSTVDELGEVSGIGEKLLSQLKARVRV